MEKKQSSVELFAIALYEKGFLKGNGNDINDLLEEHKAMHKEEIKNAQMDMFNHLNDLPYGLTYFARIQDAEDFADNYKTFGGDNE